VEDNGVRVRSRCGHDVVWEEPRNIGTPDVLLGLDKVHEKLNIPRRDGLSVGPDIVLEVDRYSQAVGAKGRGSSEAEIAVEDGGAVADPAKPVERSIELILERLVGLRVL
jgi:hypothetical protein